MPEARGEKFLWTNFKNVKYETGKFCVFKSCNSEKLVSGIGGGKGKKKALKIYNLG